MLLPEHNKANNKNQTDILFKYLLDVTNSANHLLYIISQQFFDRGNIIVTVLLIGKLKFLEFKFRVTRELKKLIYQSKLSSDVILKCIEDYTKKITFY